MAIIRSVCEILEREEGEGTLGNIMDEYFINDVEGNVWKFCELRRYYISEISEDGLLQIFRGLTKSGVNSTILHLCYNISTLLATEE